MKFALELNPVFRRESRVRWRGNRAFLLFNLERRMKKAPILEHESRRRVRRHAAKGNVG